MKKLSAVLIVFFSTILFLSACQTVDTEDQNDANDSSEPIKQTSESNAIEGRLWGEGGEAMELCSRMERYTMQTAEKNRERNSLITDGQLLQRKTLHLKNSLRPPIC